MRKKPEKWTRFVERPMRKETKNMTKVLTIDNREVDIMMLQLTMILFGIAVIIKLIGESI